MSEGVTYLSGVQYNALNQPKQYTLGSGTTALVSNTYYGPDATGWPYGVLKTIQLHQGSNPMLVNRDIGYDYAGNVISVNDLVNSENISYGYDHVDRLISAGSPLNESYVYNEIGNMTSKDGTQLYYNDAAHKHAVTSYNGVSYGYDANGCMITRGSQSIKYNPENMPVRVSASGTICRFAYDGDNVRRKRLDSNGTIHYLGAFECNLGNGLDATQVDTKYYIALGKTIALRKAGALYYVGSDHLGSTIRVTDASFNAVDQMRYKPYGESRDAGTNLKTDHRFTGQIEDAVIGLYWYNSRAYDPAIARFTAPDTIVPEPKNPQALNRYAYVANNPLRYVDPSGHDIADWFDDSWKQEFRDAHGYDPGAGDYAYRLGSMAIASGLDKLGDAIGSGLDLLGDAIGSALDTLSDLVAALPPATVSLRIGGAAFAGVGVRGCIDLALDTQGNVAVLGSAGGGGHAAAGFNRVGHEIGITNAPSVRALEGVSVQVGEQVGEAASIGAEWVTFSHEGKVYNGLSVAGGAALQAPFPGEIHGTAQGTRALRGPVNIPQRVVSFLRSLK